MDFHHLFKCSTCPDHDFSIEHFPFRNIFDFSKGSNSQKNVCSVVYGHVYHFVNIAEQVDTNRLSI